jgi:hypothetical protein
MKRLQLRFIVIQPDATERNIALVGQYARTLRAMIEAGPKGITALDVSGSWALRLSHYVHILRREHLLPIRMEWESHDGAAGPGKHGRYYLDATARVVSNVDSMEAA